MNIGTKLLRRAAVFGLALAGFAGVANADVYSFTNITHNTLADENTGEAQLKVEVTQGANPNQVDFKFTNSGPNDSSITQIYFDDGTLLGIATITDSGAGVEYSQGGSPPNLPGGNAITPAFQVTAGFLATPDSPTQPNGVNPGEWVTITFNLINGKTFLDTIAALNGPLGDGNDLRIGIHVQGFTGGGSESFVNIPNPTPPPGEGVPLPATSATVVGLMGILAAKRRRKDVQAA